MNNSDYTPIAMRGGLGDVLLYSFKIWGNGFWKYFIISLFFVVPLLISIVLFNSIFQDSETFLQKKTNIEQISMENDDIDSVSNQEDITLFNIHQSVNVSLTIYTIISIFSIFYFLCISMGANSYIAGKFSVGEKPSTIIALKYSFRRSGSYLIYGIIFTVIILVFLIANIYVDLYNVESASLFNGIMNWILLITGILFIFLSPLLIMVFPGMIFMRTNIFNAFKGVGKLLKSFYSRALSVFIISFMLVCFMLLLFLNNAIIGNDIGDLVKMNEFSPVSVIWLISMIFITGMLYGFFSSIVSLTFLNAWACKLELENIYAIKILSAALNKRKIPKSWYRNKDIKQIQSNMKIKVRKLKG